MWLALSILLCLSTSSSSQQTRESRLDTRRQLLEQEILLAQSDPNRYYLVADLAEGRIDLKAGARLLNRWTILAVQPTQAGVSRLTFEQHIEPVTHEPGPTRGRLGGRVLPLDFRGRLIEGPRAASRLYFSPTFLIQGNFPFQSDVAGAVLSGGDIKSLASALTPGTPAILISAPMTPR